MTYGCMNPNAKTTMMPVADSQYFQHAGHNVVYVDSTTGYLTAALTDTGTSMVFGVAIIPKGRGNTTNTSDDYWLSSATAGADWVPVIKAEDDYEFLFISNGTPVIADTASDCDLVNVNTASAKTIAIATSTNDDFIIQGLGVDLNSKATTADVVVKFNIEEIQADT